jgi:hypothetical protein
MSWTPTDEQVEKAAQVLSWLPNDLDRAQARAVLVAVGPHIAASAWSDGMEAGHGCTGTDPRSECFDKNPYSEKEAGR